MTSCSVHVGTEARAPSPSHAAATPAARKATHPARPTPPRLRPLGRVPRATPTQPAQESASVAQLCVDEINRYRASLGLHPLERASDREACADGQIKDDAQSGHWHRRFGACGESAQNECNASPTPKADMIKGCLRGMWGEGPGGGHYENMKSPTATKVWCGFYTTASGDVWSVQDFR